MTSNNNVLYVIPGPLPCGCKPVYVAYPIVRCFGAVSSHPISYCSHNINDVVAELTRRQSSSIIEVMTAIGSIIHEESRLGEQCAELHTG